MSYFFVDKRLLKPIVKLMNSYEMALNYLNNQSEDKNVYVIKEEYELVTELYSKNNNVVCKYINKEFVPVNDFTFVVPITMINYNNDSDSETTDTGSFIIEDESENEPKNEMMESQQFDKLLSGQMASMMSLFQNLKTSPDMASLMQDLTKNVKTEDIGDYLD